ncbi:phosphatase PAP2 family protein [Flavobacterium limi]|uniref:Phospholipid phosphatase n=1 Tax=Flavobacterium limi TaxID=2045105 RepID=A0ABQ1U6A2_9FLAO|nr:phosphatase PAP2 family protein [Flavobacterium limi]GGF10048.1 phospholipid phosphatase [Flavobacterium limi]
MKKTILVILFNFIILSIYGQYKTPDSLSINKNIKFKYQALVIPTTLIAYGVIGLESHTLKDINTDTKEEINEHIDNKFTIDDFSQYSAFLSVYALNTVGIKGKNNFKDRTIVLASAYLIMGTTVNLIKMTGNELRPDGTSNNSFPSGHTATAFMGAEFLYQEYKDVSIWYGISGYLVAAGTGFFRMYNDRHWFSDVAAGAGIGILSTKMAYWFHPLIKRTIFKNKESLNGIIMPVYNGKQYGLGMSMSF